MKISSFSAALAVFAVLLCGTAPAYAHTSLRASDPPRGAQVEAVTKVTLEFTESVRFPVVIVTGPDGLRYEEGKPQVYGAKVLQGLGPQLPGGAYTIAYRVVSRDGHPLEGEIPFKLSPPRSPNASPFSPSVTAAAAAAPTTEPTTEPTAPSAPAAPAASTASTAPSAPTAPAADERGVPAWVWIVVFGLGGVGIGMAFSMRKKP